MNDLRIDVRFKHDKPVDLVDMANSLIALNNLARTRIAKEHGLQDTKIMLKAVKEGSDLYQLVFAFGSVLPLMENFNTVASFTEYIKKYIDLGNVTIDDINADESLSPESAKMMTTLVNPIEVGNDRSSMSIEVKGENNHINVFNITAKDAEEIIRNAEVVQRIKSASLIEKLDDKTHYEKVLIEMHKTTNTDKHVKHHAYCDDIIKGKSIATYIENTEDRKAILNEPYTNYFLVDIEVNRVGDEVKLYRITRLHDVVPIEE